MNRIINSSIKDLLIDECFGDNYPADALERMAEYQAEAIEYLRDSQEDR